MSAISGLTLLCFLAPLLAAAADSFEVYASLIGKTILMPVALPPLPDSLISDLPTEETNAIAKLETLFSDRGIAVVQDGPRFVRLLPEKQREAYLKIAPLRGADLHSPSPEQTNLAGVINFPATELNQVLNVYAEVSQRTILRRAILPAPTVRLKSQSPLTRAEMLYALETVLALNGIGLVNDGDKFVQVVLVTERDQIIPRGPKPDPTAKLFAPNKVPSMGQSRPFKPTTKLERDLARLEKAFYDFIDYTGPQDRAADRLLELYATLVDKTAVPSKNLGGFPIWFHIQTPLTRDELRYAIETTLTLNNLAIIPVDEHKIRLGHISELGRGARK